MSSPTEKTDWKDNGVRVIPADSLDSNTPQTPGMTRAAAINFARVGAQKIWAGTVKIEPNAKTGPHHHGSLESVIYVVEGRARMRWGEHLEYTAEDQETVVINLDIEPVEKPEAVAWIDPIHRRT
jgi:uncharacterized RmlC-like cupin family protein